MRIAHLCLGNFFIDNCSYQENMLPKYHVKEGYDVIVITSLFTFDESGRKTYFREPSRYIDRNGFEVVRLAYKKPTKLNRILRHYDGLLGVLNQFSPDIIFLHNVSFGDTPIVKCYIDKHPNVRLFADNHGDYINSSKNWFSKHILHPIIWRHYVKVVEPYMSKCYGVTPMRCRFLKEMYHVSSSLIEYLPLGVDDDLIPKDQELVRRSVRAELEIAEDDFLIFTGGKIDKIKNTHILLEAIKEMNNEKLHLVICGVLTPEMEYLKDYICNNHNIHYLGWCSAERVMNCMVASEMACFPGTHSTLWEQSVGVGLPSVFKLWKEMEHVNVNGNCIFVKGDNVEELSDILQELSSRGDRYSELKKKSIIASKFFLYSEIARKSIECDKGY